MSFLSSKHFLQLSIWLGPDINGSKENILEDTRKLFHIILFLMQM